MAHTWIHFVSASYHLRGSPPFFFDMRNHRGDRGLCKKYSVGVRVYEIEMGDHRNNGTKNKTNVFDGNQKVNNK